MQQSFNIKRFFRRAPKPWLRRHFQASGALSTFNWSPVKPSNVQLLVDAWDQLNEDMQGRMLEEFTQITLLATPTGKVQIIDEAAFHGKQLHAELEKLMGFYECAYWTFFEHPDCWRGAVRFAQSDGKSRRSWRKRVNMPALGRTSTAADGEALGAAIVRLFRHKEARGQHCVVEQYRRNNREYYFAYAQDHKQTSLEYAAGQMTNRPHRPAFEIIFIHDDGQRTLSIWHEGRKDRIQDLQVAFARAVIGCEIPAESPRDDRVYDLDLFLDQRFVFEPRAELGIARAEVRQMDVRVGGSQPYKIGVELGTTTPSYVLYAPIRAMLDNVPRTMRHVIRVRIAVEFEQSADGDRLTPCTFDVRTPNSCNLPDDIRGVLIQRLLEDHGVEPRRPDREASDGG